MHIHVIPPENKQLLYKNYKCAPGKSMEKAWMEDGLNDEGRQRYRIVSQSDILDVIAKNGKYAKLVEYLRDRYVDNHD
jgi:hypothetical protein